MVCTHGASPVAAAAKALVIPNNDPNIIISVHTYYPTGFGLNGSPTTWGAGASDYTAMGASLDQIVSWWPDRGIVIGEWGSVSKDDLASRVKHAKAYTQDVTKRGMCPVWWDNGGGDFGLLNSQPSLLDLPDNCGRPERRFHRRFRSRGSGCCALRADQRRLRTGTQPHFRG